MTSDDTNHSAGHDETPWRGRMRILAAMGLVGAFLLGLVPMTVASQGGAELPPGHPPVDGLRLPPGHPPIDGRGTGEGSSACSPELPDGHPAIRDPRLPEGHPPVDVRPCAPGSSTGIYRPEPAQFGPEQKLIET